MADAVHRLEFRNRDQVLRMASRLEQVVRRVGSPIAVMHVCGTHEQAIARFGLRDLLPAGLDVVMGPGCPVCVTDQPEVDEGVALARQGVVLATYGDMLRVPGTAGSLADARAAGARIEVVYSIVQAAELARQTAEEIVFFATGFETTAVTTAAVLCGEFPPNFSVLSAHKYIPPVMEIVAEMPDCRIQGFLAAGHAAAITGWGVFEAFAQHHRLPVVVAGFEPLDILSGLLVLCEAIAAGHTGVTNCFPRCVTREGNRVAQDVLWRAFRPIGGRWRGIAHVPNGNLRLRDTFAHVDARCRFNIDLTGLWQFAAPSLAASCICGDILAGRTTPAACDLFGNACTPTDPVGACMVSTEGTCRIWHEYGGRRSMGATP